MNKFRDMLHKRKENFGTLEEYIEWLEEKVCNDLVFKDSLMTTVYEHNFSNEEKILVTIEGEEVEVTINADGEGFSYKKGSNTEGVRKLLIEQGYLNECV